MPVRLDPTRTTTLRRQFMVGIRKRFRAVKKAVKELVVDDNAFGLTTNQPFQFLSDPQKVEAFRRWLDGVILQGILDVDPIKGTPWTVPFIEKAYKKGSARAFRDARKVILAPNPIFASGEQAEFLRAAFSNTARLEKIALLGTRAFEELRGVSATMAQQLNRELANGLAQGLPPKRIAARMSQRIEGLSRGRAAMIARTEIVAAHAEGQLDSFEELGVEEVVVQAEWTTAGDTEVCALCRPMSKQILFIADARGMIPRHPNCRCAWTPIPSEEEKQRKKRLKKAIRKSAKQEKTTTWAGIGIL